MRIRSMPSSLCATSRHDEQAAIMITQQALVGWIVQAVLALNIAPLQFGTPVLVGISSFALVSSDETIDQQTQDQCAARFQISSSQDLLKTREQRKTNAEGRKQ